jgi:hypothetical protein
MARENRSWGYDRIVGALANLGYTISDQTVGNILKRHGIPPAPERKKTHSPGFSGGTCRRSSKASRGEDLDIEQPVSCR